MQVTLTLDSLLAAGRNGDATRFINLGTAALAQGVEDDELRLLLMRRLAECGLLRRARALAAGLSAEARARPGFAEVRRALAVGSGDGFVPWEHCAAPFEANLSALRRHYEWAEQVAEVWAAEKQHVELCRTRDGSWQVFDRRAGVAGGWRPFFGRHVPHPPVAEAAAQFKGHVLTPLAIDGIGLGQHLPWLYAATADTYVGASAAIYQVETCLLAIAVALHLNDWTALLADPRVRLCGGPDAYEQFERLVEAEPWNTPPSCVVQNAHWEPEAGGRIKDCLSRLAARDQEGCQILGQAVDAAYRGRDARWWQRRYAAALGGQERPLRVLGITSRFTTVLQYSMRDALAALDECGCQTRLLIEPSAHTRVTARQKLAVLREFGPDLIFVIDHTRYRPGVAVTADIPVLTWIQDRLPWLFDRAAGAALGPLDFCMGFCRDELVEQYGYPAARFLSCEMATDPAALGAGDLSARNDEEGPEYACEVALATNYFTSPAEFHTQMRRTSSPALHALLDAIYEELLARHERGEINGGLLLDPLLSQTAAAVGLTVAPELRIEVRGTFVRPLLDRLLRLQTLEWAASWAEQTGARVHLYGNGWQGHPRFGRYARGFVRHGPELGRAFRAAKINLHTGCNTAFHQRVLDGLAAGGFFLIRRHADDMTAAFQQALLAFVQQRGLHAGDVVHGRDLPPPLDAQWVAIRSMRGVAPDGPWEITPAIVARAQNVHRPDAGATGEIAPISIWPELERVTFATFPELIERLTHFLTRAEDRRAIALSMRTRMLEVFSHKALMKRLLAWLVEALGRS